MRQLLRGIHRFQNNAFLARRELFADLAKGQRPQAVFVTCCDSRIDPTLITQTEPGDLFVIRNIGNIVPAYHPAITGDSVAAALEYAVGVLGIRDLIICGHSHCGAVRALLDPAQADTLPSVRDWLGHAEATKRIMRENYSHLSGEALLNVAVQENVLVQLEHLRSHPALVAAIARGELNLHGWVYKIETGDIFAYDAAGEQFLPIGETAVAERVVAERAVTADAI